MVCNVFHLKSNFFSGVKNLTLFWLCQSFNFFCMEINLCEKLFPFTQVIFYVVFVQNTHFIVPGRILS